MTYRSMIKFFVPLAVVVAMSFVSACKKKTEDVITIGEYGSMTGTEATFGISTHRGIEMAIEAVNAAGGVKGKKLKLISYDNQGKAEESVTAVTKLITKDNVDVIIGEVASSRSKAAAPVAQRYQVPMISPSSTNPEVTAIGDYIFRVCFIDPFQGSVLAVFATENLKAKTAALLIDKKSDYSVGLADFFTKKFTALGGKIIVEQNYVGGDIDFKAQLTAIKAKNPDVIMVPGYYTEVGLMMKQAKDLGLKAVFIGGDGWDSPKLAEIAGPALNGNYMSNHYTTDDKDPRVQEFIKKYQAKFNEVPDGLAALGYDAALVLVDALNRAPDFSKKSIRDALAQTKSFAGVTGVITMDHNRNASKPAVVVQAQDLVFRFVRKIEP